jgi:hypothetical protein
VAPQETHNPTRLLAAGHGGRKGEG